MLLGETFQNRWNIHKSPSFSSPRFPGITNTVSPVLLSTALDSHLFSNFPCAHHYSTYCLTMAERLSSLYATFKNKNFPWPCCPCRSQLHFPIITQTQTRHFVLTVLTSHIPEALQFNFSKNITPWTHMWTTFRFGDFDTQRMQSSTVVWIQILTSQLISNVISRYFGDKVLTFHTHSLARKEEIETWGWNVTV